MLIAVAALLLQFPVFSASQIQASEKVAQTAAIAAADDSRASRGPDAPASPDKKEILRAEKLPADAEVSVAFTPGRLVAEPMAPVGSEPASPVASPASPVAAEPTPIVPIYRPVYGPPIRAISDRRQNREWLALSIAAHGTAAFDAWSTRRVISSVPQAQEMNPLLRPFASNASMYAAVQVAPTILDLLSRRMMHSRYDWARHTWWLPQAVSAVVSVASGVHNVGVYNSR